MKAVVLGCGLQGVAAAYDLIRYGGAAQLRLVDVRPSLARAAAQRLRRLLPSAQSVITTAAVDLRDENRVAEIVAAHDVALSAVPYYLNLGIARACVAARVHFCDLGGNTDVVRQQLQLHEPARAAGIALVPDCGLMPGMGTTLAMSAIARVPHAHTVRIFVGGLPVRPIPPLNYKLVFSIEGLTNEYDGPVYLLRQGRVQQAECLGELEEIEVPGIGTLEAFLTSGGASTAPWSLEGTLQRFEEKTLRYPGHCQRIRLLRDLGFLSQEPVRVARTRVVPRALFHALVRPRIDFPDEPDFVVLRVDCAGEQAGKPVMLRQELIDRMDPETGFSAMQRTTGFAAAIVASLLARGHVAPGAVPLERSVPPGLFIEELGKRGFNLREEHNIT
jgi:lysine 6-dehydrogenase